MSLHPQLARKHRSAADAARLVRRSDSLAIGVGPCQPGAFLAALGERNDFENLIVFAALLTGLYELFTRSA